MKLRGIDFGNIFVASGGLNFFGEGWPIHKYYKIFRGFDFSGSTLIAKTTTLNPQMFSLDSQGKEEGGLALNPETLQPVKFKPDCIKVRFLAGEVLNAVHLSGPRAEALFQRGLWQKIDRPFLISFMAVGEDKQERLHETWKFTEIFRRYLPDFKAPVGLEINSSCPNSCSLEGLADELVDQLAVTSVLGIPHGIKINVSTPIESIKRVADSGYCDFVDIPNTLAFGQLSDEVNWTEKFGNFGSPLAEYGGGGYSGRENFEKAVFWILRFRREDSEMKIILGGVFSEYDVILAKQIGADAVSFGRLAMLRPWRVKKIIQKANRVFGTMRKD